MKRMLLNFLLTVAILSMLGTIGCGTADPGPTMPSGSPLASAHSAPEINGSNLLGVYDVVFDPLTFELDAVESRDTVAHFNITSFIQPSLKFNLVNYNPAIGQLIFDMSITNPSAQTAYDVRAIFVSPPGSGYTLLNPDDYTMLFTPTGLDNPFIAYGKSIAGRAFAPGASLQEQFQVQIPIGAPAPFSFQLLIECSFPGNCDDAFEISNQKISNPISVVTAGMITVDIFDHQNDINQVLVDTTVFTGTLTPLLPVGGNTWTGSVINATGVPAGTYLCRIIADSNNTSDDLYDYLSVIVVNAGPGSPPPPPPPPVVPPPPPVPPPVPPPPPPPVPPVPPVPPPVPPPPPPLPPPPPPAPPVPPPVPPPTPPPVPPPVPPIPPHP